MYNLLYLALGDGPHLSECRFSILSFMRWLTPTEQRDIRILIVTDQPQAFAHWPCTFLDPSSADLAGHRAGGRHIYRAKLTALERALKDYPAPTLYFDGDTILQAPPAALWARLGPRRTLMHAPEGLLHESGPAGAGFLADLHATSPTLRLALSDGSRLDLNSPDTRMWNGGVVGLRPDDLPLVRLALEVFDFYVPTVRGLSLDQFCLGVLLQQRTDLQRADDVVWHYWNRWPLPYLHYSPRDFVRRQIDQFFMNHAQADFAQLVSAARHFTPRRFRRPWWLKGLLRAEAIWRRPSSPT